MKTAPALIPSPFADLMLHPEKLEAALRVARSENDAFAATRKFGRSPGNRATANAASRNGGARGSSHQTQCKLREIEFRLEAPAAASVMLAADFTAWGNFPLDLFKSRDGVWSIFVPLLPGIYAYRFIVDGRWSDDPHSDLCAPNPFGAANAVVKVT